MGFDDDLDLMDDSAGFGDSSDGFSGFGDSGGFGDSDGFDSSEFDSGEFGNTDDPDGLMSDDDETSDGEQLEFEDDEDDFLDGVDDYQQANANSDPLESQETKATEIKKTAIFAVGLGLIVLVIILFLGRMLSNYRKTQDNASPNQTVENTVKNIDNNSINKNNDVTLAETHQSPIVKSYTGDEGWIEIEKNTSIPEGIKTEGIFTVTDVRHYAKVANAKNDKQIKSIVTGNISGVVGTFEFEVPFSKARKLSDGLSFKIEYSISENNGYKIVEILDF